MGQQKVKRLFRFYLFKSFDKGFGSMLDDRTGRCRIKIEENN